MPATRNTANNSNSPVRTEPYPAARILAAMQAAAAEAAVGVRENAQGDRTASACRTDIEESSLLGRMLSLFSKDLLAADAGWLWLVRWPRVAFGDWADEALVLDREARSTNAYRQGFEPYGAASRQRGLTVLRLPDGAGFKLMELRYDDGAMHRTMLMRTDARGYVTRGVFPDVFTDDPHIVVDVDPDQQRQQPQQYQDVRLESAIDNIEMWWNDYGDVLQHKLETCLAFDEVRRSDGTHIKHYREHMERQLSDDEYFYVQSVTARRRCLYPNQVLDEDDDIVGDSDDENESDDVKCRPKVREWRECFALEDRLYERAHGNGTQFPTGNDEDDVDARVQRKI